MHLRVKERLNVVDSNVLPDFLPGHIDDFLEYGQYVFIERVLFVNPDRELLSKRNLDAVRTLVVQDESAPVVATSTKFGFTESIISISNLDPKYRNIISVSCQGECEGLVDVVIVPQRKLSKYLQDQFQKPSKAWRRMVAILDGDVLRVYSEGAISSVLLTYIKHPRRMFFGGYDTVEYAVAVEQGAPTTGLLSASSAPQDCELPEAYHDEVIDHAVRALQGGLLMAPTKQEIF